MISSTFRFLRINLFFIIFCLLSTQSYQIHGYDKQPKLEIGSYNTNSTVTVCDPIWLDYCDQQNKNTGSFVAFCLQNSSNMSLQNRSYDFYIDIIYRSILHRQYLHLRSQSIIVGQEEYSIIPEDYGLIAAICNDNPHYNSNQLFESLLRNSNINQAALLMENCQSSYNYKQDLYINLDHFQNLEDADVRLEIFQKAVQADIDKRYQTAKENLTFKKDAELKKCKFIGDKEKKTKIKDEYAQEVLELDKKRKYESEHWNGIKKASPVTTPQTATTLVASQKKSIDQKVLQQLHEKQQAVTNQIMQSDQVIDQSFRQVMEKRDQAFKKSIAEPKIVIQKFTISPQITGFLQSQNIDVAQFQQIDGLPIQHELTGELIHVLDGVAQQVLQHYEQKELAAYCAHLAQATQQANQQAALEQAVQGTNCCHGMYHYLLGITDTIGQSYQQFKTALDYMQPVLEEYAVLMQQHAVQAACITHGLEAVVRVGMIVAPTATVAATNVMIGTTAFVMTAVCLQALVRAGVFGGACIAGNWKKVREDLDNLGKFLTSKETAAMVAGFAGGSSVSTPILNSLVNHTLSLRPVIIAAEKATGELIESLHFMTSQQAENLAIQGRQLLQRPEFQQINMIYEQILGCHIFDIFFKNEPVLAPAIEGVAQGVGQGLMNLAENSLTTQFFTQTEKSIVSDLIKTEVVEGVKSIPSVIEHVVENIGQSMSCMQNIVQQEIQQQLQQPFKIIETNLSAPIDALQASKLRELSQNFDKLNNLAECTNNFQDLTKLIQEEVMHLNRICQLEPYRIQIKNFLDQNKLFYMDPQGKKYFIKDVASYHIHATDYLQTAKPTGGHSNYGGNKLDHFKPQVIKEGPLGAKDVILHNPRNPNLIKLSTIYPETWTEYMCDLKAIEVMMSDNVTVKMNKNLSNLVFIGPTSEGLTIKVIYDIINETITTHYLLVEAF